jgi:general secretion pathway protein A
MGTYLKHFRLREQPFGATPDPKFLYFTPGHAEALAALHYGLTERRGFLALTARPGMGKTTLLHYLLERWKDRAQTAFLFVPPETREKMISAVLEDLGLACGGGYAESCRLLRALALECRRQGKRLLLIFDEAQHIPPHVLEEIRLLSNFETPEEKLIEIILAGQPDLAERLRSPECEQLHQRIAVWSTLGELNSGEVARYIDHRVRLAGRTRGKLFTRGAEAWIAEASRGIPRNINSICFEALSTAFARGKKKVDEEITRLSTPGLSRLLSGAGAGRQGFPWAAAAAAATLAAGALLAGANFSYQVPRAKRSITSRFWKPAPPIALPAAPSPPVPTLVAVGPNDTVEQIALEKYGRWDADVWNSLQKQNPWLASPGDLEPGRLLVLPPGGAVETGEGGRP